MSTKQTENRIKLDSIEVNLREAAGVQDQLVRKILTSMLQRQAEHFRKLEQVQRSTKIEQVQRDARAQRV